MADVFDFYVKDNRTIQFNLTEPIMLEDSHVSDWVFHIPRVLNNIDMSGWAWWLVHINARGQKYSELLELSEDPESPLEKCIATYTVDYSMSIRAGVVRFSLEAINADTQGTILNEWHTQTYQAKVQDTLQGNQVEFAETESDIISALIVEVQNKVAQLVGGATPEPKSLIADMTDTKKVYLYVGEETGESTNYWYYYNGSAWVAGGLYASGITVDAIPTQGSTNAVSSGGVYEALHNTDTTLSQSGQPADAKAVGDAINGLEGEIGAIVPGLSTEAKQALLACFRHVAWTDEHGRDYYDALESALYEDSTVIGVNRDIGTSGTEIVTNEKRMLSDPIPFTNTAPITVQVKLGSNSYAYNFKFTDTNNKIILNDDIRTPFNNIGYFKNADNSITVDGWGTTAEELTFKDNITNAATVLSTSSGGQVPNGYFRLLFANASDTSGVLPQEPISGYVMVQGKKYTLTEINRTVHVTRGIGTSGTEIVTNEKRMLSDPILFTNTAPITVQMLGSDGTYGYNIKFINTEDAIILSDNICNELGSTALFYDENNTFPTGGWIKDSKQYTLMAGTPLVVTDAHSKVVGEQFSGYLRILYCNGTDASATLPVTAIPNKFIVQGLVYTLQES